MTTCTPSGLPIISGSDRPCDIGNTLCSFANAAELRLDAVDSLVDRTATTVPMVKVASTIPVVLTNASANFDVSFDTVEVDTDNMFNGNVDAESIVFPHAGFYLFQSNIWATSTGAGANVTALNPNITLPTFNFGIGNQFVTGLGLFVSGIGMYPVSTSDTAFLRIGVLVQSTDTITITRMEMMAIWLGDLA